MRPEVLDDELSELASMADDLSLDLLKRRRPAGVAETARALHERIVDLANRLHFGE